MSTSVRIKEKNNFLHVHERKIKEIKKDHQFETLALEKYHKAALEPTNIIQQN